MQSTVVTAAADIARNRWGGTGSASLCPPQRRIHGFAATTRSSSVTRWMASGGAGRAAAATRRRMLIGNFIFEVADSGGKTSVGSHIGGAFVFILFAGQRQHAANHAKGFTTSLCRTETTCSRHARRLPTHTPPRFVAPKAKRSTTWKEEAASPVVNRWVNLSERRRRDPNGRQPACFIGYSPASFKPSALTASDR